jgi:predicted O-methyltransferase YrrM
MILALRIFDFFLMFFYFPSCCVSWIFRRCGAWRLPLCSKVTHLTQVLPIRGHYYEPAFLPRDLLSHKNEPRDLPNVEWQEALPKAVEWIRSIRKDEELLLLGSGSLSEALNFPQEARFIIKNGSFDKADAEFLYLFIRSQKPKNIIEVGSGNSTKVILHAVAMNKKEDSNYNPAITCVEPYEAPFLEKLGVNVVRKKVENCSLDMFSSLKENDLLFIDSSHILKPSGDVLFLYQRVIPRLNSGVYVHVHDIFIPFDYPAVWVKKHMWLWNEQYILEIMLTQKNRYEIICPLNAVVAFNYKQLEGSFPWVKESSIEAAGSFWFKIK